MYAIYRVLLKKVTMKLLYVSFTAVSCLDETNQSTADHSPYHVLSRLTPSFDDDGCPNADLGGKCISACQADYMDCFTECGSDLICMGDCSRILAECNDNCPCLANCPLGCKSCKNPICNCVVPEDSIEYFDCASAAAEQEKRCVVECGIHDTACHIACEETYEEIHDECPCKDGCPDGCPCLNYICREAKTSVLVLTTVNDNPPLRIDSDGEPSYDISMTYDYRTQVHGSCSAFFRGEMYVLGGALHKTQVSVVDGCNMKRLVDLPFEFSYGTCEQIDDFVAVCFASEGPSMCKKFKGVYGPSISLEMMSSTKYAHRYSHLAQLYDELVIVGDWYGTGNGQHTTYYETYNVAKDTWTYLGAAPRFEAHYAAVSLETSILYFGGLYNSSPSNSIYRYAGGTSWEGLGSLKSVRQQHNAIKFGEGFLIIGGAGQLYTEYCWFNDELNNSIACQTQEPELKDYSFDEVFAVVPRFCSV